jgi:hypothetical protein
MSKKKRSVKKEEVIEPIITLGMKQHLKYLVGLSIVAKIALFIVTVFIIGSSVDMYQSSYYYEHFVAIFHGDYPYINNYYEYPILSFIPVIVAWIPSVLFNSVFIYLVVFVALLIIADCITTICVYLIARKIWNDSKTAFTAAIIYLTAISAMYFVMTENSTFASCLLMVGLTMVLYSKDFMHSKINVYFALICGYFVKVFPIIALPFVILYNSRSTSLKQEIISSLKIIIPVSFILTLPIIIFNPSSVLKTLLPARMDIGYFPETLIWTLHVWVHDILHFSSISIDNVLMFVYACMIIGFLLLFYTAFKYKKQEPVMLIKFIACAIMILVLAYKVRSPGYIIWFTPFICILIADNIYKIGLFYVVQLLAYIEFPLTFWILWTNIEYTNPIYSTNWYLALLLFTLEFSLLIILSWVAIEPVKIYNAVFKSD